MQYMGDYQVLAHVETPECSMRFISLGKNGHVAPHYHNECNQLYAILQGVVEATLGDRTFHLRPYETMRIEKETVHSIRALGGPALILSISIPPMKRDDQHPVE